MWYTRALRKGLTRRSYVKVFRKGPAQCPSSPCPTQRSYESLTKVLRKSYGSFSPNSACAEALHRGLTRRPYAKALRKIPHFFLDKSLTRRPCGSVAQRSCVEAIREVIFQWRMLREARSYAEASRMGLTRIFF